MKCERDGSFVTWIYQQVLNFLLIFSKTERFIPKLNLLRFPYTLSNLYEDTCGMPLVSTVSSSFNHRSANNQS